MNAVMVKREHRVDGKSIVTTRALQLIETIYVERTGDELVQSDDLLLHSGWQPGEDEKAQIEKLVRGGMTLDAAFWQASAWDDHAGDRELSG